MATERVEAIFKWVSQKLEEIVPSERFYVVLYDPTRKNLSFPFIRHDGAVLSQAEFPWLMRSIHSEDVLPDWVITHGESMLVESGLSAHLETKQIGYWPNNPFPEFMARRSSDDWRTGLGSAGRGKLGFVPLSQSKCTSCFINNCPSNRNGHRKDTTL